MNPLFKIGTSEDLNASQAVLLLEIGESHCCFGILDYANQMMIQLGYYKADERDNGNLLAKVLEEHAELKQSFRQAVVGYYLPESVLIPAKFFQYEEIPAVLEAMFEKSQDITVSESIAEWQVYNSYNVPASIHELLSRYFSKGIFWHVYSIHLKNGIDRHESGFIMVDFKPNSFSVIVAKNNSLLLAQIFSYNATEDVLYWLLKICNQFSLPQGEVRLVISGLIDKQSAVYKGLYQYFADIEFAFLENDIKLSSDFDDYPVHFFSSLYKMASCV